MTKGKRSIGRQTRLGASIERFLLTKMSPDMTHPQGSQCIARLTPLILISVLEASKVLWWNRSCCDVASISTAVSLTRSDCPEVEEGVAVYSINLVWVSVRNKEISVVVFCGHGVGHSGAIRADSRELFMSVMVDLFGFEY